MGSRPSKGKGHLGITVGSSPTATHAAATATPPFSEPTSPMTVPPSLPSPKGSRSVSDYKVHPHHRYHHHHHRKGQGQGQGNGEALVPQPLDLQPLSPMSAPPGSFSSIQHKSVQKASSPPPDSSPKNLKDHDLNVTASSAPVTSGRTLSAESRSKSVPGRMKATPLELLSRAEAMVASAAQEAGRRRTSPPASMSAPLPGASAQVSVTGPAVSKYATAPPPAQHRPAPPPSPTLGGHLVVPGGTLVGLPGMVETPSNSGVLACSSTEKDVDLSSCQQSLPTTAPPMDSSASELAVAVTTQQWDEAIRILSMAEPCDPNTKTTDEFGYSLLRAAAEEGNLEVCQHLLKRQADVNARDSNGMTALMGAVAGGDHSSVVSLLLDAQADPAAKTSDGFTALAWANRLGRQESASVLRAADSTGDRNPFH